METGVLAVALIVGVGACPLLAWLGRRRGRAGCCASTRPSVEGAKDMTLAELRAERDGVQRRIAAATEGADR